MSGYSVVKDPAKNARIRRRLLWDGAHVPGAAAEIIAACRKDPIFYVNYFCFTFDPRKKQSVIPFITYDFQDEAILELGKAIDGGYDVCIGKSRDMGASWLNIIVPEHQWHFCDMRNFLMVSRNESYVDESGNPKTLFWKIDFLHKHQPKWLRPKEIIRRALHIENGENGSVIDGESTTGEVARGDRRTAILLDEFAAFDTKAGYNALTATQSATNCRIFNSTPKGVANAFHDVYKKSSAHIITMHWSLHPDKNKGLYTSERDAKSGLLVLKMLSDWKGVVEVCEKGSKNRRRVAFPEDYPFVLDGKMRSPWYDRECSRAVNPVEISQELDIDFNGSDYQFFDPIAVERYKDEICRDPVDIGDFEVKDDILEVMRFTSNPKGRMFMWHLPNAGSGRWDAELRFIIGVDVSAGTGASNSTMAIYEEKSHEKYAEYANPNILPDDFGRLVVATAKFFNDALIVPDRSGPTGEVLVRRVLAEGYNNVYRRRNTKKLGAPITDEPGVWLNPATRTQFLQNYRDAIGHCKVLNLSARAMDECLRFICKLDGMIEHSSSANATDPSGARSNHGDIVIADALASMALTDGGGVRIVSGEERITPEGSIAWRMETERRARLREASRTRFLPKGWKK